MVEESVLESRLHFEIRDAHSAPVHGCSKVLSDYLKLKAWLDGVLEAPSHLGRDR